MSSLILFWILDTLKKYIICIDFTYLFTPLMTSTYRKLFTLEIYSVFERVLEFCPNRLSNIRVQICPQIIYHKTHLISQTGQYPFKSPYLTDLCFIGQSFSLLFHALWNLKPDLLQLNLKLPYWEHKFMNSTINLKEVLRYN